MEHPVGRVYRGPHCIDDNLPVVVRQVPDGPETPPSCREHRAERVEKRTCDGDAATKEEFVGEEDVAENAHGVAIRQKHDVVQMPRRYRKAVDVKDAGRYRRDRGHMAPSGFENHF